MPLYAGLCGPSNPTQSVIADCERLVNWYLERVESQAAPTGAALYPTPGLAEWITVTDVGTRGFLDIGGRAFAVVGGGFYELFENGTGTLRGPVAQDAYPATLSYNGLPGGEQVFITSGGNGYVYDCNTPAVPPAQVLTGDATMGGHLNGRFLAFDILTGHVRMSALNDGLTWDGALWFARSQAPDPWQSMLVVPPEIYLIGEQSGEVWYDSGAYPQPFAPRMGAFFPVGTCAPFSAALVGDTVTWLSRGPGGAGTIIAAQGYAPRPISNYAVETALHAYNRDSTLTDCETLVYSEGGHTFACYSFARAGGTWVYDFSLGAWHERGEWVPAQRRYQVWSPRVHGYAFGRHLVGDRTTGRICQMGDEYGDDAGTAIRRLRIPPPLWAQPGQRLLVSRFELMVESGLGLAAGQGSDPQVMLRTSTNARTWGSERLASAGKLGDYNRRCVWHRCGSSDRIWVPELTVTDPVPYRIAGAFIEGSGFQQAAAV